MADAVDTVLRRMGIEAEIAQNGNDAWKMIQEHPYALMITDIMLPGLNGVELIRRTRHYSPETCIIAVTGHGDQILEKARRAGAHKVLKKPFTMQEIFSAIETCGH